MTTWTDGGMYGQVRREIASEDGRHLIATVRVKQYLAGSSGTEPWPEGEANFHIILAAPRMLEALEMVWDVRQSASYEEQNEAGVTGYAFYLTESQCAQIRAAIATVKGGDNDKSGGA